MAGPLRLAPEPGTCPSCGAERMPSEPRCGRCGSARPLTGWLRMPDAGETITADSAWMMGTALEPQGPVLRYQAWRINDAGEMDRSQCGVLQTVAEASLFPSLKARAHVLTLVRHPALAGVHEVGTFRDRPYPVDAAPTGVPLHQVLHEEGALSPAEVRRIALADGLAELHAQGVTHGHVSPRSVVLVDPQMDRSPVLVDFPAVEAGPWLPDVAPEVLLGQPPTPRSDLFGLGYLLATLLKASDVRASRGPMAWAEGRPGPALQLPVVPGLADDLRDLLLELLDPDPARRPRSATEVVSRLQGPARVDAEAEDNEIIPADPAPEVGFSLEVGTPLLTPGAGWVWPAAAVALLFLGLGGGWALSQTGRPEAPPATVAGAPTPAGPAAASAPEPTAAEPAAAEPAAAEPAVVQSEEGEPAAPEPAVEPEPAEAPPAASAAAPPPAASPPPAPRTAAAAAPAAAAPAERRAPEAPAVESPSAAAAEVAPEAEVAPDPEPADAEDAVADAASTEPTE